VNEIYLSKGAVALVDEEDFLRVSHLNWFLSPQGYAYRTSPRDANGKRSSILLHRLLLDFPAGLEVDHINGNRLDNRRENLRVVTSQQNSMNQRKTRGGSRFKGVAWAKKSNAWRAAIKAEGVHHVLGFFTNESAAAVAYNLAALRLCKQYARLNEVFCGDSLQK
jgi:HNH endonuclease